MAHVFLPSAHNARGAPVENMVPRKAEIQSWGTLQDRQCPSEHCQTSEHLSAPHATKDAHG